MEPKRLLLAGGLLVVAVVVFTYVRNMATPPPAPAAPSFAPVLDQIEYVDVLVASGEIPFGTRLNEAHMKWMQWPAEVVSPDFISNQTSPQAITEMVGSVARSIIYENEPISERKLVKAGSQGLMATLLAPGMRAVTTRISVDTAAGGFIQPGDRVDIILTTSSSANPAVQSFQGRTQVFSAATIFENVRVMTTLSYSSTNASPAI